MVWFWYVMSKAVMTQHYVVSFTGDNWCSCLLPLLRICSGVIFVCWHTFIFLLTPLFFFAASQYTWIYYIWYFLWWRYYFFSLQALTPVLSVSRSLTSLSIGELLTAIWSPVPNLLLLQQNQVKQSTGRTGGVQTKPVQLDVTLRASKLTKLWSFKQKPVSYGNAIVLG